jgi:hypothetical protein
MIGQLTRKLDKVASVLRSARTGAIRGLNAHVSNCEQLRLLKELGYEQSNCLGYRGCADCDHHRMRTPTTHRRYHAYGYTQHARPRQARRDEQSSNAVTQP